MNKRCPFASRLHLPLRLLLVLLVACISRGSRAQTIPAAGAATMSGVAASGVTILNRDQASVILPATVFFHGQSASVQARNSAGLKTASGRLLLATLVDTAGYSSAIKQTYQAYLLTELPLNFGGKRLAPGAYGFGYLDSGQAVVLDLGGNELARTSVTRDAELTRPTPLQILASQAAGEYRLYLGRSYVALTLSEK